jgi:hypothetical protein
VGGVELQAGKVQINSCQAGRRFLRVAASSNSLISR